MLPEQPKVEVKKLFYTTIKLSFTNLAAGSIIAGSFRCNFQPNIRGIFIHEIFCCSNLSAPATGIFVPHQSTLFFSDQDSYNIAISSVFDIASQIVVALDSGIEYRRLEMSFQGGQDIVRMFEKPIYFGNGIGISLSLAGNAAWALNTNYVCPITFAYELARL